MILITGAAGHIGGRLFKDLALANDLPVRAAFRTSRVLPAWTEEHETIFGDVSNPDVRAEMLNRVSQVVHLATRGYSSSEPPTTSDLREDLNATVSLANSAARSGVRRFIFLSSIHVYGRALVGEVSESTVPIPETTYGKSRLEAEEAVARIGRESGMEVVLVRMSNSFGVPVFERPTAASLLLHDLCVQASRSGHLRLRSNGRQFRNIIALSDAVGVLRRLINVERKIDGTYLLVGPETLMVKDIARMVSQEAMSLFGTAPNVEVDNNDLSQHVAFDLKPVNLQLLGVPIGDHRCAEIRELLRHAIADDQT